MNYFLVMQNKSYKEEQQGQYLWAPQQNSKGQSFYHWKNVTQIKEGDLILHCFKQKIVAMSIAKKDSYISICPRELKEKKLWGDLGWRVDADYHVINNPINIKNHTEKLLELQPKYYGPFNKNGDGKEGYLFEINKELFEYIINESNKSKNWQPGERNS